MSFLLLNFVSLLVIEMQNDIDIRTYRYKLLILRVTYLVLISVPFCCFLQKSQEIIELVSVLEVQSIYDKFAFYLHGFVA